MTLAYPTNRYTYSGLSVGDRYWFWARMIDGQNAGQFTDAVEGSPSREAAPITNYLHGQITRTELGKSLIDSLKNDVDTAVESAVAKEVTERKAAVGNVLSQINAQAQRNGTAINELRNVDTQQAKQIATITAKAENALVGIATEQKARTAGDKANADKITAVIARVGSAESTLTHLQSTKASKTEVAGIAQSALQATWRADAKSAVDSASITLANADQALGQRIDSITSSLGDARAQISAVNQAVTNANSALGQRIDTVSASLSNTDNLCLNP